MRRKLIPDKRVAIRAVPNQIFGEPAGGGGIVPPGTHPIASRSGVERLAVVLKKRAVGGVALGGDVYSSGLPRTSISSHVPLRPNWGNIC